MRRVLSVGAKEEYEVEVNTMGSSIILKSNKVTVMSLYPNFQLCFARRQGRLAQWLTSTVVNLNMTECPKPQKNS